MVDEESEKTALDMALIKCLRIFAKHGRKLRLQGDVLKESEVTTSNKSDVKPVSEISKKNE